MYISNEEIWDKFTCLTETKMACIIERLVDHVYMFKYKDFNEGFERAMLQDCFFAYDHDFKSFAEMIAECVEDGGYISDDMEAQEGWCLLDVDQDYFNKEYDFMNLISDYEEDIVNEIRDDSEVMAELFPGFFEEN